MALETPLEYYSNESSQGNYQYISLSDVITNFMLLYVGDDKQVNNIKRYHILALAKRALQELNYDVLREVKGIELEMGDNYFMTLPPDYVQYVRISIVGKDGRLMPLKMSTERFYGHAYLQDHAFNVLFDNNGYPLEGTSISELNTANSKAYNIEGGACSPEYANVNYGIDTTMNLNGEFIIDKKRGKIFFDSNTSYKTVLLEYISDGLEYSTDSDIKVHKFAEQVIYNYIKWMLLDNKLYVQEYIIKRARNEYFTSLKNAKIRLMSLKLNELAFVLKGQNKTIK
jgi:hypothetical protein